MSLRRVRIVLLCEDSQHEAFTRRFLKGTGWNTRELRVEKSASAAGSAEQWVRENFIKELTAYRQRRHRSASALITIIDADNRNVQDRINELQRACEAQETPFRASDEAVAIAIPKRNIETWVYYLNGEDVNENDTYPKLEMELSCKPAVDKLVQLCRADGLAPDALPSLVTACNEYTSRIKELLL